MSDTDNSSEYPERSSEEFTIPMPSDERREQIELELTRTADDISTDYDPRNQQLIDDATPNIDSLDSDILNPVERKIVDDAEAERQRLLREFEGYD